MYVKSSVPRIAFLITLLSLILAACAAPPATSMPETLPDTPVVIATPTVAVEPTAEGSDLRPIEVADVQVEIGVGSPIPVNAIVSGTWPDLCAQVAQIDQRLAGSRFEVDLLATPADEDCPPDLLGLPFRIAVPLNMVDMPVGSYAVSVNGVETSFAWDVASSSDYTPAEAQSGELQPVPVASVAVEVGVGSPIPVEVVAGGDWPQPCSQLAEVKQVINGNRVEISLMAAPANPECPPDYVGVAYRFAMPLNMVEMPLGPYTVVVNGVQTDFEWTATSSEPIPVENLGLTVAYIGADGNLWLADASGGPPRQITSDAAPYDSGGDVVVYYFPKISSDGRYIAARRDAGVPISEGMQYTFGLWVYDTQSGESRPVWEGDYPPAGIDWKPGTHLLAYGLGSDPNYFINRGGKPDPALATGIYLADLDSGGTSLLVEPQNGYSLFLPAWSPDGRFLSFDELVYNEGRGPFAYYDLEAGEYISWEEPLGFYDWSPDGSMLAYDRMTYTATGTERIFTRARVDGVEEQVSPEVEGSYAFLPVYSPDGTQIAYLVNSSGLESVQYTLVVQDLPAGEPRQLGTFESVWYLEWSPDGRALVFSAGPHLAQQVYGYDLVNGASTVIAQGSEPSVALP